MHKYKMSLFYITNIVRWIIYKFQIDILLEILMQSVDFWMSEEKLNKQMKTLFGERNEQIYMNNNFIKVFLLFVECEWILDINRTY